MMALRRAVQICGGLDALGDSLNTSTESLQRMIAGVEEVPLPLFTQTVGLASRRTSTPYCSSFQA
jgi:hypothetical protein